MSEKLITNIEAIPLSGEDLIDIARCLGQHKTSYVLYDHLARYQSIDQLFSDAIESVYILLDVHTPNAQNVGHWVTLIFHRERNQYWYYDPYGLKPTQDLALTKETDDLLRLLKPVKYEYNSVQHQEFISDVNTCGRHCVIRSVFSHLDNIEYNRMVIKEIVPNYVKNADILVSLMTAFNSKSDQVIKQFYEKK